MPVAQDALLGGVRARAPGISRPRCEPVAFPEIETHYDDEAARREAARCYRCDAETGSADYETCAREDIFVMARTKPQDAHQQAVFTKRLAVSTSAHFHPEVATLDDIVFLPANLSRLVIDPYRDACRVETELSDGLVLGSPFLATGTRPSGRRGARSGHALAAQGSRTSANDRSATACPGCR